MFSHVEIDAFLLRNIEQCVVKFMQFSFMAERFVTSIL